MAAQAAARGKTALEAGNYDQAIKEYSQAIKESPTSPEFFTQRSIANQRAGNLNDSLVDAEAGVLNGIHRAKKEAITEAQFRRGVALYKLGQLGNAKFVLNLVKQRDEKHKQADMWINKIKMDLAKLEQSDEKRTVTVTEKPSQKAATTNDTAAAVSTPVPARTPADKIRYDWYQNPESVYFTLMAKGVPKDKCVIDITERSLSVSFPTGADSNYDLHIEPLFAAVDSDKTITRILPSKVEIVLTKTQPGQKWHKLESDELLSDTKNDDTVAGSDTKNDEGFQRTLSGPSYPTSSKNGPKDWDKVAKESMPTSDKPGAAEDDDDFEGGDPANHFFKKLFKGASPEMQRAMMKSYTESNGTALSTNWEEVSKGPVETSPPDGMEAKPWK